MGITGFEFGFGFGFRFDLELAVRLGFVLYLGLAVGFVLYLGLAVGFGVQIAPTSPGTLLFVACPSPDCAGSRLSPTSRGGPRSGYTGVRPWAETGQDYMRYWTGLHAALDYR